MRKAAIKVKPRGMKVRTIVLIYLVMSLFTTLAGGAPTYAQTTDSVCPCLDCPGESIQSYIDETTGNPNIPLTGPGLNIMPEPPTTVDWTDLLNPDGTSKGAVPINPNSDITISATLVGSANLIAANKFHHPPQSSSTITVNLSGSYNLKGRAFYLSPSEYVESSVMTWDNFLNATVIENNRLIGTPGPQASADYYIENVSSFQVTIGNTSGNTLSQNLTVPNIHLSRNTTGPIYTNVWGSDGSNQQGEGMIPEFAFAGYKSGYERPTLPTNTINVKDFGAIGDGSTDDTQAIKDAIASLDSGGVFFPQGTYVVTDLLDIEKSNIFLIGEDKSNTKLYFPYNLQEVLGDELPDLPSWSGGFVRFRGTHSDTQLSSVTQEAERGATRIYVADTTLFYPEQEIRFYQNGRFLTAYMAGDEWSANNWKFNQLLRVNSVGADYIDIDRPLRVPIIISDPHGSTEIYDFEPTVRGGGVSNLTFEFPVTVYPGHWNEKGYNAIELTNAVDVVIDNVNIHNADSGIFAFPGNMHNELSNIIFTSERVGAAGHHGIVAGNDMVVKNVTFDTVYLHDLTVTRGSSGNVFKNNSGVDLNLDFHHGAPYETLLTDNDLGAGAGRWLASSGGGYGYHSGKGTVYWNLKSSEPVNGPPSDQAPPGSLVMAGLNFGLNFGSYEHHVEYISPEDIRPQNIHEAQLIRRYAKVFAKAGKISGDSIFDSTSGNVLINNVEHAELASCYNLELAYQWQKRTFSDWNNEWENWEDVAGASGDTLLSEDVSQSTQYRRQTYLKDYPIYVNTEPVSLTKVVQATFTHPDGQYDGNSGDVVAHNPALAVADNNRNFSVEFWIRPEEDETGRYRAVVHKGTDSNERTFAMWLRPDDMRLHYRIGTIFDSNEGRDSEAELPVNIWTHVAYVLEGNKLKLYLNGILDSESTLGGAVVSNTGDLYIGDSPWYSGMDGQLSCFTLYDGALTADMISDPACVPPAPTTGDVNCDNQVNVIDALYIMQHEVSTRADGGSCPLTATDMTLYLQVGDVNADTNVDVVDALIIMQCEAKMTNSFCP